MPVLRVEADLRAIAVEILQHSFSDAEWAQVESDDMFARGPYVGGYDADEHAFVFYRSCLKAKAALIQSGRGLAAAASPGRPCGDMA